MISSLVVMRGYVTQRCNCRTYYILPRVLFLLNSDGQIPVNGRVEIICLHRLWGSVCMYLSSSVGGVPLCLYKHSRIHKDIVAQREVLPIVGDITQYPFCHKRRGQYDWCH